jgi:hypothetical protein
MGSAEFALRETFQRPNYLWFYWCLTILGCIWLLFALVVDELITIQLQPSSGTDKQTYWCGWQAIRLPNNGFQDYEYTSCNTASCKTNFTAGQIWFAFNMIAIALGYLILGFGLFSDIREGGFDVVSIKKLTEKMGYKCSIGYTTLGTIGILFWQGLGLLFYSVIETCSKKSMWSSIIYSISSFSFSFGPSFALDVLSLIFVVLGLFILLVIRLQYGKLPTSKNLSLMSVKSTSSVTITKSLPPSVVVQ